jgi:hypothetical protein
MKTMREMREMREMNIEKAPVDLAIDGLRLADFPNRALAVRSWVAAMNLLFFVIFSLQLRRSIRVVHEPRGV